MSYATPENVKSLFRDFHVSSDPAVTDIEIQEFLDDAEAIINAHVGSLYSLPIISLTNPESFKILRRLETYMVADIVDKILNNYTEAERSPGWGKKAQMLLEAIVPPKKNCKQCEPTLKLVDATYLGTDEQKSRITISATEGRVFERGKDNW